MRLIDADAYMEKVRHEAKAMPQKQGETFVTLSEWIMEKTPSVEPNLILPERMERGDCYEVGETIVVMSHDDYYDLLCKSMENEPKQGEWIEHEWAEEVEGLLISNYECSECHSWERSASNFCPNCGERMKGADDERSR